MHGSAIAKILAMSRVVVPRFAGVFSALGLLLSPPRIDLAQSIAASDESDLSDLHRVGAALSAQGRSRCEAMGAEVVESGLLVDVRYIGQAHEVTVAFGAGDSWETIADRFHTKHKHRNGFSRPENAIEVVTVRSETVGRPALTWNDVPDVVPAGEASRGTRQILTPRGGVSADVYWRAALVPGTIIVGPAVIEEDQATTFVDHNDRLEVLVDGSLEISW